MQLDLNGLPDYLVHVSGFGGQDLGILELDAMPPAGSVFGYSRFVWMSQTNVPVVLFDPGINGMASMPNILEVVRKTCYWEHHVATFSE
jgi:hypothetical protein